MSLLSQRALIAISSVTQAMNEKVIAYKKEGKDVFNLTAGQLPFRPEGNFIHSLQSQLSFLASYQYAPIKGLPELIQKMKEQWIETRLNSLARSEQTAITDQLSVCISNGSKHSLFNIFSTIINPGDQLILFSPYWVSFPEMVRFWGGVPINVECHAYDSFTPDLDQLQEILEQKKIRAIVLNSPNNPTGVHYSESWMKRFAQILVKFPEVIVISDEIYEQLYYYDPAPTFFYQFEPSLLSRTIIINGISKTLAATGLRIGSAIGPNSIIDAAAKLQSHSTSGASSLIQHALLDYDDRHLRPYLQEIRIQLRRNAEILKDKLREYDLTTCWYQTISAFYFLIDFMPTPYFKKRFPDATRDQDHAQVICDTLLHEVQVAIIPGSNFAAPNCARISFTLDPELFEKASDRICHFLKDS